MNNEDFVKIDDQTVKNLLESVAEEKGFRDYKIETCSSSMKGEGYLGTVTAVRIVQESEASEGKVLNLVVKRATDNDTLRKQTGPERLFIREIYMYEVVFPTFRKLEAEKGLPPSYFTPRFYKGNTTEKNEALVLKNLKEAGYKLCDTKTPMDDDHVSFIMTQYGRLHALSLALRDQNFEEFKRLTAPMDDVFVIFSKDNNFVQWYVNQCRKFQEAFDSTADPEDVKTYDAFIDDIEPFIDELPNIVDAHSVVLHGDCWTNNIFFKYSDSNNPCRPTDVRFIDFQFARVGSPVQDLSYFFYTCSSKEIIDNLDHYLDIYYNSLSSYLLKLGSDPLKVFPYSILKEHWKLYARMGLFISACSIHIMLSEKGETVDLSKAAESGEDVLDALNYKISNADVYNDRMKHIVLHFIKNKFI